MSEPVRIVRRRSPARSKSTPAAFDPSFLTDELPILVAFIDNEQTHRYGNRAYEEFFGKRKTDVIGKTVSDVMGPEHYAVAEQYIRRTLKKHGPFTFAATLRRADGSLRDVEVSYSPHPGGAGDTGDAVETGFISVIRDVTDSTFMTEARGRLAAIIDSSDDAIVSKTLQGVITSWNGAAERMFGYTAAEAVGQNITLIIPPERKAEEDEVLARLRRGQKIDHFETVRRAKDGREVHISLSVSPIRNAAGEIIGASKVARDITEQRLSEQALRATEEYRRAVLESMPECVKVLDRNGVVVQMNPAGLRMVDATSPSEVIGRCVYPLVKEQDREAFRRLNESVFSGGAGGTLEFSIRGLKGTERIFETNAVPLRGATGDVIGALGVTRDITSRRYAELRDAFLVRLDDEMRALSDPTAITDVAARLLAEHLSVQRCGYAEVNTETRTVDVTGNYTQGVASIVGHYDFSAFGRRSLERLMAGGTFTIEDTETDEAASDALERYRRLNIRALIGVPLMKSGRLVASMGVHNTTPRRWRSDEIELVQLVANRCWESIERARVQRELRDSEQQFRTLANAIPNLAWMAHADGYIFWYNRRWYEYTGTTAEQMQGWGWRSVHDPAILPSVMERWKVSLATGAPFDMVFPLKGADGSFRAFLTRVEPIKDENGRIVRWFGTNTDVTLQQEAERREKRAKEIAEVLNRVGPMLSAELDSEKLTQKITDIATEAVRAEFGALFHTAHNDAGEVFVLYTLSGAPREAFSHLPMPRNTEIFGPTFRGNGPVRSDDIRQDPRHGKSSPFFGMPEGHLPVRSYLAVPIKSRTGHVLGGLFFGHSTTGVFTEEDEKVAAGIAGQAAIALDNAALFDQTRRSSEALRRSNDDLRRVNDDLNQFAYSASHDLREPLRMVSIYTQLLGRKIAGHLDSEGQQFANYVLKGASRLESLIRDLLAYTQAADMPHAHAASTDAKKALESALSNLSTAIGEAGAQIHVTGDLPWVAAAEVHVTQILQNLIGNAVKYRREKPVEIRIGAVRRDDRWEFFVADNGIGIEAEYKEHIFGIFKRLHNADEYSGTGIGLAICQRIVQRYGGRIWVESELGRGSTFFFTLPAAE